MFKIFLFCFVVTGQLFALSFDRVYFGAVDGKSVTLSIAQSDGENEGEKDQTREGAINGYLSFQGMEYQHYIGSLKNGKMYLDLYKYDRNTGHDVKQGSFFRGKINNKASLVYYNLEINLSSLI